MIDLNDITVFARVVEAGSFTAAARLLGMPKATVSRRIAALEREVGVRLIQRTTRSLKVTEAGRLYYEQSSQALRTIEDANLLLAETRAEPSGTIRISAPGRFRRLFPDENGVRFPRCPPESKGRVAPQRRQAQSGRKRGRSRFPDGNSCGFDADRPQARLLVQTPVRKPGLCRAKWRAGGPGRPRSPSMRNRRAVDSKLSLGS